MVISTFVSCLIEFKNITSLFYYIKSLQLFANLPTITYFSNLFSHILIIFKKKYILYLTFDLIKKSRFEDKTHTILSDS